MYSCQTADTAVNKNFSGEELFNGIFFGQGEVASIIPEINNQAKMIDVLNPEDLSRVQQIRLSLTNKLKEQNPNFFTDFKNAMQSGQHLKIEKMLKQTSEMLIQGILDLSNVKTSLTPDRLISQIGKTINLDEIKANKGKFDQDKLSEQLNKMQLFDSNSGRAQKADCVAVVVVLVLAVVAAAVAIVFIFWVAAVEAIGDQLLKQQMIVNSISVSLAI